MLSENKAEFSSIAVVFVSLATPVPENGLTKTRLRHKCVDVYTWIIFYPYFCEAVGAAVITHRSQPVAAETPDEDLGYLHIDSLEIYLFLLQPTLTAPEPSFHPRKLLS
jgi:hypothetical protein